MTLRPLVLLAVVLALLSGCLDESSTADAGAPTATEAPQAAGTGEPKTVATQEFFAVTAGDVASVPVNLDEPASDLALTIEFGSSAFSAFTFRGIDGCDGLGPGTGVFPNSSQWTASCGAVPAGGYVLHLEFSGAAQGTLTVVAVP